MLQREHRKLDHEILTRYELGKHLVRINDVFLSRIVVCPHGGWSTGM